MTRGAPAIGDRAHTRFTAPADLVPDDVWTRVAPDAATASALRAYGENHFRIPTDESQLPLDDELFVAHWRTVMQRAAVVGTALALTETVSQLRFPVAEGMSASPLYRAMVLRGDLGNAPAIGSGVRFVDPEGLTIGLHGTAAGAIPVIECRARADFEVLVQAATRRNEPVPVPASMGACMVAGYNNWQRLQAAVAARRAEGLDAAAAFAQVTADKALYQDRFILLSAGEYSGVPAAAVHWPEATWRDASVTLRREHEATHYFTKRVFGSMQNALLDEVLADYAGIVAVRGTYSAQWFCTFLGVESPAGVHPTGRLHNYRGTPPLPDAAFAVLAHVVRRVAATVESLDRSWRARESDLPLHVAVTRLARLGLDGLLAHPTPS